MDGAPPLWILPALPLAGGVVNGLFGRNKPNAWVAAVACAGPVAAFLYAVGLFFAAPYQQQAVVQTVATWMASGALHVGFTLYLDPLSMVMTLVVTGVGSLIHVYATGYMAHEGGYYRFFSYLNLFTFFMLALVLAGNYALLFVGWEGVGLCSYLLIGFYFRKKSAADAGKKAFIVNRIGDFGFILGLFLMFGAFGSLDFTTVLNAAKWAATPSVETFTAIGLLLFVGAAGKSAQVPLYVWLPDAMEGPTPVSALIHAATMVTAGVYMVARSALIYQHAPLALQTVAVIGGITALFAATIGLVQTDIKRVLAYSTVSQLGYMFLACGVAAYTAGIFHLVTHAFFKALLFLGAGSVITALHHEQDLREMGGLRKRIPVTYWTMLMGCLAIAGVPPFSGFFSKDEILWKAWSSGATALWAVGMATAAMTAFYMFRLFFLTFAAECRSEAGHHAHEPPLAMTGVLVALAALSVIGGFVGIPHAWGGHHAFETFLAPALPPAPEAVEAGVEAEHTVTEERVFSLFAVLAGLFGIALAYYLYVAAPATPLRLAQRFSATYRMLLNKYFVDEIYAAAVVRPLVRLSDGFLFRFLDALVIDGAANGLAARARGFGAAARQVQSGNIRSYAAWVLLGAVSALFLVGLLWGY